LRWHSVEARDFPIYMYDMHGGKITDDINKYKFEQEDLFGYYTVSSTFTISAPAEISMRTASKLLK
jgi:hypothetical protein